MPKQKKVRHVLGISGGKDSTALAIYMRDKIPEIEYFSPFSSGSPILTIGLPRYFSKRCK